MNRLFKLVFLLLCFFPAFSTQAQEKFAVLLAVDEYYEAPGVKSRSSLEGCVNDANAMKSLLVNRFGFQEKNILTLYNERATKKNLFDAMKKMYRQCKPGDAAIFYYSGHGVWMSNSLLKEDTVKRGMSQAIVLSDLYAPGWDCLVSDETLKNIFNQFVNKKIILTSLFDCCYSGNIPMPPPPPLFWTVLPPEGMSVRQTDVPYTPKMKKPAGCPDAAVKSANNKMDSDGDGVPDCRDWEINSMHDCSVDSMGVCQFPDPEEFITSPSNQYTAEDFQNDSARSFNLRDAISTSWRSSLRPSDRKGSRFLSFSACSDLQKALEITDVTGKKHGAFTAALLTVYRKSPPGISVKELREKLRAGLSGQSYYQTPFFHEDPARLNGNLLGISNSGFSDKLKAMVISNQGGQITINKGLNDGITKGNVLSDASHRSRQKIRITKVSDMTATAIDSSNGQIKPGEIFELTDDYVASDPFVRIYISSFTHEPASFESFIKTTIIPYTVANRGTPGATGIRLVTWDAHNKFQNIIQPDFGIPTSYLILPMPSYIADNIRAALDKDQNWEIVNDIKKANLVLYFNYAGRTRDGKNKFEIFFHPAIAAGNFFVPTHTVNLSSTNPGIKELRAISAELISDLKRLIRISTNRWMNTYPRR
jgi:hypothetical protein